MTLLRIPRSPIIRGAVLSIVFQYEAELVPAELDISTSVPLDAPGCLIDAVVSQSRHDASALRQQEGRDVLGQDDLVPRKEPECARQYAHLVEVVGRGPIGRNLAKKS